VFQRLFSIIFYFYRWRTKKNGEKFIIEEPILFHIKYKPRVRLNVIASSYQTFFVEFSFFSNLTIKCQWIVILLPHPNFKPCLCWTQWRDKIKKKIIIKLNTIEIVKLNYVFPILTTNSKQSSLSYINNLLPTKFNNSFTILFIYFSSLKTNQKESPDKFLFFNAN
jgi:hypothetical protein